MKTFRFKRFKANTKTNKNLRVNKNELILRSGIIVSALIFCAVFYGLAVFNTPESEAIEPSSFNAGRIIDDSVFYNANTMTVAEIQSFLDSKSPACDMWGTGYITGRKYPDGTSVPSGTTRAQYAKVMREKYGKTIYHDPPYVCLNKYYENPETHQTLYDTQGVAQTGMQSAAQIIYNAAQKYSINPQVLIAMIKKESLVWGDNWPLAYQYNTVMGYGCPDTAPCSEQYFGFYNQVEKAAWQLKYYREHPNSYNYRAGMTNNIQYHPNASCGTKQVYIENIATASLYIYTPYTPNDAALRAYPGTGDSCSSYGNRNFYAFFMEWWGSTYGENYILGEKADISDRHYALISYNKTYLGNTDNIYTAGNQESKFYIYRDTDGYYIIKDEQNGKVLDIPAGNASINVAPTAYPYHGGDNQKWILYYSSDGSYLLSPKLNKSLVIDFDNSFKLSIYTPSNNGEKIFLIDKDTKQITQEKAYRISSKAFNDKYIDIYGGVDKNSIQKDVYTYTKNIGTSDNQTFTFIYNNLNGYYLIKNTYSGLYLNIADNNKNNNSKIIVSKNNTTCESLWKIISIDDQFYYIENACTHKVIDVNSWDKSLLSYRFHGGINQQWRLIEPDVQLLASGYYTISTKLDGSFLIPNNWPNDININSYTKSAKLYLHFDEYTGSYKISNKDDYVLDLTGSMPHDGTKIIFYPDNNTLNQRWLISKVDDSFIIESLITHKALDIPTGKVPASYVTQYTTHMGINQRWKIEVAD